MFDQRNQQFQTIILSSSVMFAALSTVIIQGPLNQNASVFLLVSYSLSTSLSFAFLFLTLLLCIEIINRASTFMYKRARKQTEQLKVSDWSYINVPTHYYHPHSLIPVSHHMKCS